MVGSIADLIRFLVSSFRRFLSKPGSCLNPISTRAAARKRRALNASGFWKDKTYLHKQYQVSH